jgi:hypothetical protein
LTATKGKSVQAGIEAGIAVIILLLVSLLLLPNTQAQDATAFLPADRFNIPELNGSIGFAVNGSYSSAVLENNTWRFSDLELYGSSNKGTLEISVQDSDITITDFRPFIEGGRNQAVRYIAEGKGVQTINFELNYTKPTHASEWMVLLSANVFLGEGEGWRLLRDDTIVITGQTGNVSVIHYRLDIPDESHLPFYQQHSVALITIAVVAATVTAAALISVKVRKSKDVRSN